MTIVFRGPLVLWAALAAVLAVLTPATPAHASHYAVGDVPTLIPTETAEKLRRAGIQTTEDLLQRCAKSRSRKELARAAGLTVAAILDLARRADLLRLKGVGPEMVLILQASGVKTVSDLAKRQAAPLAQAAASTAEAKKSPKPPAEEQFAHWIAEAKKLPVVLDAH